MNQYLKDLTEALKSIDTQLIIKLVLAAPTEQARILCAHELLNREGAA